MTVLLPLAVLLLAAAGAIVRWLLASRWNREIPMGTLAANVVASFVLGLLAAADELPTAIIGIGFLGALSTWSTLANEVADLSRSAKHGLAVAYLAVTVVGGIGAAWVGLRLG